MQAISPTLRREREREGERGMEAEREGKRVERESMTDICHLRSR